MKREFSLDYYTRICVDLQTLVSGEQRDPMWDVGGVSVVSLHLSS